MGERLLVVLVADDLERAVRSGIPAQPNLQVIVAVPLRHATRSLDGETFVGIPLAAALDPAAARDAQQVRRLGIATVRARSLSDPEAGPEVYVRDLTDLAADVSAATPLRFTNALVHWAIRGGLPAVDNTAYDSYCNGALSLEQSFALSVGAPPLTDAVQRTLLRHRTYHGDRATGANGTGPVQLRLQPRRLAQLRIEHMERMESLARTSEHGESFRKALMFVLGAVGAVTGVVVIDLALLALTGFIQLMADLDELEADGLDESDIVWSWVAVAGAVLPFLDVSPVTLRRIVRELGFAAFLMLVLQQLLITLRWVREWLILRGPIQAAFDNVTLDDADTTIYLPPPQISLP